MTETALTMRSWQPIDSAPRDGTPVLAFVENSRGPGGVQYVVWFGQQGDLWTFFNSGDGDKYGVYPAFWQPLPEPPK